MTSVVLVVLVVIALLITVRSARRAFSDHHTLEVHQKALDTLGEMVQQSEASPSPAASQPHVRVVSSNDGHAIGPTAPRWAAGRIWPTNPVTPITAAAPPAPTQAGAPVQAEASIHVEAPTQAEAPIQAAAPIQAEVPAGEEPRSPVEAAPVAAAPVEPAPLPWAPSPRDLVPPPLDNTTAWPAEWAAPVGPLDDAPAPSVAPAVPPSPASPSPASPAQPQPTHAWTQPPAADDESGVVVVRVPSTPPPYIPEVQTHQPPLPAGSTPPTGDTVPAGSTGPAGTTGHSERPVLRFDDTGAHPEVLTGQLPELVPAAGPAPVPSHAPFVPPETATALVMGTADFSEPLPRRRGKAHARRVVPSGPWLAVGGGVAAAVILVVSLLTFTGKSSPPKTSALSPAAQAPANQVPLAPPTTVAAPVQLVQSDNQEATFSLSTTASIDLVSTQRCWVEVRSGSATGTVVYSGTMVAGQHQSLPSGQTLWIRLGYPPGVSVVINGTPLAAAVLSTPSPYNLKFQTTTG